MRLNMEGSSFSEIIYALSHNHEIEFVYKGIEHKLEPAMNGNQSYLIIYQIDPFKTLEELSLGIDETGASPTPREKIIEILNCKCFDGKSFYEIEKDVEITAIS